MLIGLLCLSLALTACTATTQESRDTSPLDEDSITEGDDIVSPPGTFPIVDEPVTLRVFATPRLWVEDMSTNYTTLWYEEKTNVHIEWIIGGGDAAERINLILASQTDLPDAFMVGGMSQERLSLYGSQGVFLALNEYIDNLGVGIKKIFEYNPGVRGQITAPDGNIYGLPAYNECYHCDFSQKAWINQKWLDNLGLDIPTTTEEFYNVLKAFKENDANDNGDPNDEIPMAANANDWNTSLDGFLMNPFIYNQGRNTDRLLWENGQWVPAFTKPEWQEGIRFIKRLYQEGLIFEEAFITDRAQIRMLTGNPTGNLIGFMPAAVPVQFVDIATETKEEYVPLAPLEGPTGLRQTAQYTGGVGQGAFVITNACEYPEVAFRWADGMYSNYDDWIWMGEKDVDWSEAKEGEVGLDGKPASFKPILPYGEPQNKWWGGFNPVFITQAQRNAEVFSLGVWSQEKILYDATKELYEPFGPEKLFYPLFMKESLIEEASDLRTTIREYVEESIARFVTGDLDIDSDWDRYLSELNSIGLDRMLQILNEEYERQYGDN